MSGQVITPKPHIVNTNNIEPILLQEAQELHAKLNTISFF
jgi:hypothetical protein